MKLLTPVDIPEYPFRMDHHHSVLMLGSCFTEEVGRRLEEYLFPVCINPFGTIYNPLSVNRALEMVMEKPAYGENDLDRNDDLWFSFDHSTAFSSTDPAVVLERINQRLDSAGERMNASNLLILTWGTAWVFRLRSGGRVVSNCHKIPSSHFTRSRLAVEEIVSACESVLDRLFGLNQELKVIFTVSPVRHWKDGAHGNQLSKATLLLAVDKLMEIFPKRCFYFPSYEIVMDELRDYRWYARDMLHPAEAASGFIWKKFEEAVISPEARELNHEIHKLLEMKRHRPRAGEGNAFRKWQDKLAKMEEDMKSGYPHLQWSNFV